MARERKTDYQSKGYKHREHRSKKGREGDFKEKRKQRIRKRDQQEFIDSKRRKFNKFRI
jgi:hypothetical protein